MSFLLRNIVIAYSEKEAQARLTAIYDALLKGEKAPDGEEEVRELVAFVHDPDFLLQLYDRSRKVTAEKFEYFERRHIVARYLAIDPKNLDFQLHVLKSEPESYVWSQVFEEVNALDDDKAKKKILQQVRKSAADSELREQVDFELASKEELKAIVLKKVGGKDATKKELQKSALKKLAEDQEFQKKIFDDFSKPLKPKKGEDLNDDFYEDSYHRESMAEAALSHIKDQTFLKEIVKKYSSKKQKNSSNSDYEEIALKNIDDEKFILNHIDGHENTSVIQSIVSRISDEKALKELYEKFGESQKGQTGYKNKQWTDIRSAIIKRLSKIDPDFIMNLILKEKKKSLRLAALKEIDDPEVLKKLILSPRLSIDVKVGAIEETTDQGFLKDLAESKDDERVARASLLRLVNLSKTSQDTYITYFENFPEADDFSYSFADRYLRKDSPRQEETVKRVLFSEKFPIKLWEDVVRWPETKEQVVNLLEFCKQSTDIGRIERVIHTIISSSKKMLPKTETEKEHNPYEDEDSSPTENGLSKAEVVSGLTAAFSKVKTGYVLKDIAKELPSDVVISILKKRPELNNYLDTIMGTMKLDDTTLQFLMGLGLSAEQLSPFFISGRLELSNAYALELLKTLKPEYLKEKYDNSTKDYREPLVNQLTATKDLEYIAEHDASKGVRWTALRQLFNHGERSPEVLHRIIENDPDPKNVSWAMILMPEAHVDLKWGDRFVTALFERNTNFQQEYSDNFYYNLLEHISKENRSAIVHRMKLKGEGAKDLAEKVLKLDFEETDKIFILNNISDKNLYEQHLLHDPSLRVRKECLKNLDGNSAEVMLKVFENDENHDLRAEALCFISPDDLKADMVDALYVALQKTTRPHEVEMSLKQKAYKIAPTDELKASFAKMLPNRLLDEKDQIPKDQRKHNLDMEDERMGENVGKVSGHQEQLLRLLLTFAKPPKEKQAAAQFKSSILARYRI